MFAIIFCGQLQLSFQTEIYNNTTKRRKVETDRTYPTLKTKSMLETEANPNPYGRGQCFTLLAWKTDLFFKLSRSLHLRYLF